MKTTFQELKVGDEFTDETGIKYRKIHDNAFCGPRYTAMVINHPVLGGTEVLINPGVTVNKIVVKIAFDNALPGDVLTSGQYLYLKTTDGMVLSFDRKTKKLHNQTTLNNGWEAEFVGHVNLLDLFKPFIGRFLMLAYKDQGLLDDLIKTFLKSLANA